VLEPGPSKSAFGLAARTPRGDAAWRPLGPCLRQRTQQSEERKAKKEYELDPVHAYPPLLVGFDGPYSDEFYFARPYLAFLKCYPNTGPKGDTPQTSPDVAPPVNRCGCHIGDTAVASRLGRKSGSPARVCAVHSLR
jgi:hypothetical protein